MLAVQLNWITFVLATPVPVTGMVLVLPFVALLEIAIVPVALPVFVGANPTARTAVWPGAMMVPLLTPLPLNPVPLALTD